jgi:tRNA (guanine-N7-)-methyltransferase
LGQIRKMSKSADGEMKGDKNSVAMRPVRSFVLRGGRLTEGQKRALDELWPRFGVADGETLLDLQALFGNQAPVILEIGFGNGDATWQMASSQPLENFLGVEVHRPGVGHLLLKIEQQKLDNIRIACADAVDLLRLRIPENSLCGVRIYFPDPWPKKRHHKRRIIQTEFVRLLASRMRPQAILHLATDWVPYADFMLEVVSSVEEFVNLSPSGDFCEPPEWRPHTKYEQRGEKLGHHVRDLLFERV